MHKAKREMLAPQRQDGQEHLLVASFNWKAVGLAVL